MTGENRNILNRILLNWPKGTVATLKWFRDHGGYQQLNLSVMEFPVLSFADLYDGKICAALDRQHQLDGNNEFFTAATFDDQP